MNRLYLSQKYKIDLINIIQNSNKGKKIIDVNNKQKVFDKVHDKIPFMIFNTKLSKLKKETSLIS